MAEQSTNQSGEKPCCDGTVVTMDKVIQVINATERYDDNDARTCFWMFVEGLNGDENKKSDVIKVLGAMKNQRPVAHERILANASRIFFTK